MRRKLRSLAWTLFLIPFLLLPYRWVWLPCGLAAALLVWPRGADWREPFRKDGTLIVGAIVILLVRCALDVGYWLPWIGVAGGMCYVRMRRWWPASVGYLLAPLGFVAAALLLLRPTEWVLHTATTSAVPPEMRIVCAGDSLTAGVEPGTDDGTYVAALRSQFPCEVINAGVASDRAADLLARLDRTVIAHRPDLVLLFIGGNDYLDGTPRSKFARNLEQIASAVAATGARLVVVEVPTGIIWNPYAGIYRDVARRYRGTLVPETQLRWWYSIELLIRDRLEKPLTIDGIHLSPHGAERVADWLASYLVRGKPATPLSLPTAARSEPVHAACRCPPCSVHRYDATEAS